MDDRRLVGTVGDKRLSLAEAVELLSGTLSLSGLSKSERQRVSGDPRSPGRRHVQVSVGRGVAIAADGAVPVLKNLENTVLDGGGAVVTATDAANGTAFAAASSSLTIRDFGITGFSMGVTVTPAGVTGIRGVTLDRLSITASSMGINITAADASSSIGILRDVRVTRGRFQGPAGAEALVGVNVVGQAGAIAGAVDGVEISDSWFGAHMLERIQLVGVQAVGSATATGVVAGGSQLRNVRITRNTFTTCPDPCVLGYSALALGGQIAGAAMERVLIEDNVMPVNGLGVTMISGYTLAGGITENSRLSDVVIRNNRAFAAGPDFAGRCQAIVVAADWTDFHAGVATGSRISDVVVSGNRVSGCKRGLLLAGTFAVEQVSGTVRDSSVERVQVRGNTFEGNTIGVEVVGAGLDYTRLWGRSPTNAQAAAAVLAENAVRRVTLDSNGFLGNGTALVVVGSAVRDTNGHVVTDNSVVDVRQQRALLRSNQRDCRIDHDLREDSVGVGHGNSATGVSC